MGTVLQHLFPHTEAEERTMNFANAAMGMIQNDGPVTMEVPGLTTTDITAAFRGLERFDTLPREEQGRWQLHELRDPKYDEPDDGAIRKEPPHDWKLFFHYRPGLEKLLLHKQGIELEVWQQEWIQHMATIWQTCTAALHAYALELDRLCPGYHFAERLLRTDTNLNVLRILRYVPHAGTLAKWHTDRAGVTFHVAESHPGLRTARGRRERDERTPATPNVLVFSGDQLDTITRGEIQHCWHTVVDTTGGREARHAMVFFGKFWTGAL